MLAGWLEFTGPSTLLPITDLHFRYAGVFKMRDYWFAMTVKEVSAVVLGLGLACKMRTYQVD